MQQPLLSALLSLLGLGQHIGDGPSSAKPRSPLTPTTDKRAKHYARASNWPSGKVHRKTKGDTGQHPKLSAPRKRKRADAKPPSWPATKNQMAQSRPLIVINPLRHGIAKKNLTRAYQGWCERSPKWVVDAAALGGGQ